jgi:hypothetical protein
VLVLTYKCGSMVTFDYKSRHQELIAVVLRVVSLLVLSSSFCCCPRPQQYISPEHASAMSGNNSQGPVYKIYVSLLTQLQHYMPCCLSGVHNTCVQHSSAHPMQLDTATVFLVEYQLTTRACFVLQSSVGPQPESTVPNPGSMTFGTAQRLPKPGKDGVPGPGGLCSYPGSAQVVVGCAVDLAALHD